MENISIWLAGDSTVETYADTMYPRMGWGQVLQEFCCDGVKVKNHAAGGRSTKSFVDEGRWGVVLSGLRGNDFVMIQFGHNDQKVGEPHRYAPADGAYREYLHGFIADVKQSGAHPVLVTSVCRRKFVDTELVHTLGDYPLAMREVATEASVPCIDLNRISWEKFSAAGSEATKEIFMHLAPGEHPNYPEGCADDSHFCEHGAHLLAGWIVDEVKSQRLALGRCFRDVSVCGCCNR